MTSRDICLVLAGMNIGSAIIQLGLFAAGGGAAALLNAALNAAVAVYVWPR